MCATPTLTTTPIRGGAMLAQVAEVPDAAGAHLQHQEPGVRVGLQHGVRQAELVVERAGRRHGRAEPGAAAGAIRSLVVVLPDEPVMPTTVRSGSRSSTARASRPIAVRQVGDHDRRHAGDRAAAEHRDRAGGDGRGGEVVAVDLLAGERDEQAARGRPCGSRTRPAR